MKGFRARFVTELESSSIGLIPVFPPARLAHRPVAIPVANHTVECRMNSFFIFFEKK